jgi:DNA modification methylase
LGRFDLLLTDPPYGLGIASQLFRAQRTNGTHGGGWDDETLPPWVMEMIRSTAETQVVWGGNYYPLPPSRGWFVWHKPDAPPSMANAELAWTNRDQNTKQLSYSISATNGERLGHPTQKPLAVISWCLSFFPDASTVIDPFAGVGTTGRACKDLGKRCVLIEREERYCEIAAKRMAQEVLPLTAA